jgi:hypothetical protein
VKDAVNGLDRYPKGSSMRFDALAIFFLSSSGNRDNEAGSPDHFLWIEMALVVCVFSCLNFHKDANIFPLLQGSVPIVRVHQFFISI